MAANSDKAAKKRRGPGRPFKPGVSGNPNGRPKGFGALIRERTKDGEELVDFAQAVMRAELAKLAPKMPDDLRCVDCGRGVEVSAEERMKAMLHSIPDVGRRLEAKRWLSDQGWGKAPMREEESELAAKSEAELVEALAQDDTFVARIVSEHARLKSGNAPSSEAVQ